MVAARRFYEDNGIPTVDRSEGVLVPCRHCRATGWEPQATARKWSEKCTVCRWARVVLFEARCRKKCCEVKVQPASPDLPLR